MRAQFFFYISCLFLLHLKDLSSKSLRMAGSKKYVKDGGRGNGTGANNNLSVFNVRNEVEKLVAESK